MSIRKAPMKALAAAIALSLALADATGCGATGAAEYPASSAHTSAKTLASIQEGHEPSANDPLIPAIERATLALVPLCNQSITDIDRIADAMSKDLKQHGIMQTPLSGSTASTTLSPKLTVIRRSTARESPPATSFSARAKTEAKT